MELFSLLKDVDALSLGDFLNFYELSRLLSIRELARRKSMNPSRVSRSLAQLEEAMGQKLMSRAPSGMTLTEDGRKLQFVLEKLFDSAEGLRAHANPGEQLTIGSTSYLSNRLVATSMDAISRRFTDVRVVDFPPDELVASGIKGAFNVGLHLGRRDWPQSWTSKQIGEICWILCARRGHPLTKEPRLDLDKITKYPFIFPMYWSKNGVVMGDDYFPVSIFKRTRGFGTSTAEAGIQMVRTSDQIAFLPDITVYGEAASGGVVALAETQFSVPRPLYLSVRADQMSQKKFEFLASLFSSALTAIRERAKRADDQAGPGNDG